MTSNRVRNWAGYSIETIAAIYESDAAAREAELAPDNPSAQAYWESAWQAEDHQHGLDELEKLEEELAEDHPIDCTCIFCIPGA